MLETADLRLKLLDDGGSLGQPFYHSAERGWTKLTYAQKDLESTVKVNGDAVDMASQLEKVHWYHPGLAQTSGELVQGGGPAAILSRTYSFTGDGMVFVANYTFTAMRDLDSIEVWLGTSDDWVGTTDRPSKEQGKFVGAHFEPSAKGKVLRVHSGEESVFVFSTDPQSEAIILRHYGRWHDVQAATASDLADSTSDGAYAIYVPLGSLQAGETKSACIYYAAADESRLAELLEAAARAHGPVATTPVPLTHNLLVDDFEACNNGGADEFVDCPSALECQEHMASAHSACRVMLVSTMGISELKKYICGLSTCGNAARLAKTQCSSIYPDDVRWLAPVFQYQDRFCSFDSHPTDLINDHSSCELSLQEESSEFCKTVNHCYDSISELEQICRLSFPTMDAIKDEVCTASCVRSVEKVRQRCGQYQVVQDGTHGIVAYQPLGEIR
ncbi:unnamed protein product [Effrenium voratum]|nr:unnamed protein product [Effrenium voratum]